MPGVMPAGQKQVPGSLHIELLGGFRVRAGGHTIAAAQWNQRKVRGLFKFLALASGQRLHRDQVLEALWPDLEPDAASNNLHRATHALRRILEPALAPNQPSAYLRTEDDMLALRAPGGLWIDVEAFQAAAREAQTTHSPRAYLAALELYRGDLLPDDRYEDWAAVHREHLRQWYITLLEDLAHLRVRQGETGAAVATFERLLVAEPAHEGAHAALMRLYARTGRRYQALRQYQRLCAELRRELDIVPDPATQRLAEAIRLGEYPRAGDALPWSSHPAWQSPLRAGTDDEAQAPVAAMPVAAMPEAATPEAATPEPPPVVIAAGTRTNLASQSSSFVGRAEELAALERQLAGTRLLTLRGGGGCGKTRLAWQVGASQVAGYRDGVWMIELAPLLYPELVPQAVAGALGVREAADQPLSATLASALGASEMLLILDNCEHLLDAVAALARELLAACPGMRILATSRRPLRVTGEQIWRVPSMTAPNPDDLPPFERLLEYDAIQLFVARAAASRLGFRLTPRNALAVVRICHRLDGIPLAIELAAGRSRLLTADQIAARLDDAFALLTHGDSTQLPRQQTLRASIAWSEQLLSVAERTLLWRLAVFAGGWTLDAAEAICAGEGLDPSQVLDALGGLVDASLVNAEEHPDGMR